MRERADFRRKLFLPPSPQEEKSCTRLGLPRSQATIAEDSRESPNRPPQTAPLALREQGHRSFQRSPQSTRHGQSFLCEHPPRAPREDQRIPQVPPTVLFPSRFPQCERRGNRWSALRVNQRQVSSRN